jgi:hypothetical protein
MTTDIRFSRALLVCGIVAGPLYVAVTMAQALSRDGFDLTQHRFSWLTTGDLGWIHQLNMVIVGALAVLFGLGVGRVFRTGKGAVWAPRLLVLFGAAYIMGGLLTADPVAGFPPGTPPDGVHTTWHGVLQNATRAASTLLLIAANLVIALRFAAEGRRGWAAFYGTAYLLVLGVLTGLGFVAIGNYAAFAVAILSTPWIVVTALATHLYQREAVRRRNMPVSSGMRNAPIAGHARPS